MLRLNSSLANLVTAAASLDKRRKFKLAMALKIMKNYNRLELMKFRRVLLFFDLVQSTVPQCSRGYNELGTIDFSCSGVKKFNDRLSIQILMGFKNIQSFFSLQGLSIEIINSHQNLTKDFFFLTFHFIGKHLV